MPRTTFRLRVAPVLHIEMALHNNDESIIETQSVGEKSVTQIEQGEWSEVTNIATKDTQTFEVTMPPPG
jgi:hypothetical protein